MSMWSLLTGIRLRTAPSMSVLEGRVNVSLTRNNDNWHNLIV